MYKLRPFQTHNLFFMSILTWITIFSCSYNHVSVLTIISFLLHLIFLLITIVNSWFPSFSWRTAGICDGCGLRLKSSFCFNFRGVAPFAWHLIPNTESYSFTLHICTLFTPFPSQLQHVGGAQSGWTLPCTAPMLWPLSPQWLYRTSSTHRTGSPLMLCLFSWDRWVNISFMAC